MQPLSILFGVLAIAQLSVAQSGSGYNYPSPFNPLTPGANDLGNIPGGNVPQQPPAFSGSQPGYNNVAFGSPGGPPSVPAGPSSTLQPGYNPQFVQSTPSSLVPGVSHSSGLPHSSSGFIPPSAPGASFPSSSGSGFSPSVDANANYPGPAGAPSFTGIPSASKGFDSSFPHSGSGFGSHSSGGSFPVSSSGGFPGQHSSVDSGAGFGNQGGAAFGNQGGGNIGQSGFGGQNNNFGDSGDFNSNANSNGEGNGDYSAIPGQPGADYPIYTEIPKTSFDCKNQQLPGYYADVEAQCQVFHICALNRTFDFLCPNGTIFSQEHLVCVWWNQFDCNSAPALFGNNANIYDYSKNGQQNSNQGGFSGQGQVGGFNNIPGSGIDASQQGGNIGGPGFISSQSSSSHGLGGGFGSTSSAHSPSHSSGGNFGSLAPPHSSGAGFGAPHSSAGAFGPAIPSHSSGAGFIPAAPGTSSHSSGAGIPSTHGYPSPSGGSEQYPIAPPSQIPDFSQTPVISPTIPSSPTPFGVSPISTVTGYPAAGTPSPINTPQLSTPDQPSREYLPGRGK